ncbi:hypothetical protein [Streptomyces sp. NPDC005385]|uniref:hypothetical protein n=1 Tax=Streptomyces sp. NPDC005385 TaxID=3157039 RepID=UPI0033BB434E
MMQEAVEARLRAERIEARTSAQTAEVRSVLAELDTALAPYRALVTGADETEGADR